MKQYISANQATGKNDSERIQAAISMAKADGTNAVCIPKYNERTGEDLLGN